MDALFDTLFKLIAHLIIIVGLLLQLGGIVYLVLETIDVDREEAMLRVSAIVAGFILVYGSKATGVAMSDIMIKVIASQNPFWIGLVGVILPALLGYLMIRYFTGALRKSDKLARRG